ncbi:E3 ubiquitin-protein ligase RGLG5-like [Phalaenopsis equestris]|uniref:E3 ubiquitin-protein ligase RGLG5-like n=1 Tax=Phalaenopsis equestris TaxID=78828 RepID=UPI0009E48CB1|nr:E3 ubiquitin-protein ligase RGLG5-like [Phalaenopsis equestris]
MGGKSSSESGRRRISRPASFKYGHHSEDHPWSSPYFSETPQYQNYPPSQSYDPPVENYPRTHSFSASYAYPPEDYYPKPSNYPQPSQPYSSSSSNAAHRLPRLDRRYSKIADNYKSLDEVTEALAQAGLESSNLIVGIDFTKSNEWTGKHSFNRRSLHHISDRPNPYEQAISIIGKTLSKFDEDNLIPCFGFGDASTHDQDIFSFYPDERPCNGFAEALSRYREIVPHLRLAGPTSFAPIIEMAMTIVEDSGGQYHVLLIIADGQVTRSVDTVSGQFSSQERKTVDAIVKASDFPLSIILVGVGDGPWDMMKEFDDNIPTRSFDNFQFVDFTEIMSRNINLTRKDTEFALAALMEIPSQYNAALELGILGRRSSKSPERVPLPPPVGTYNLSSTGYKNSHPTSFQRSGPSPPTSTAPSAHTSSFDNKVCPICLTNLKDMAFGCGHQTCCDCGVNLQTCPICRSEIHTKIKLY